MNNLEDLLEYCDTESQTRGILAIISEGSAQKAATKLGVGRRSVDKTLITVKKNAALRGYAPDYDLNHPVAPGQILKGTSTLYDADGNIKIQWSKTQADKEYQRQKFVEFVDDLVEDMKNTTAPAITAPPKPNCDDLAAFFIVGDAHIGMRAWGKATGHDDHDTRIGINDLHNAFRHLIAAAPSCETGYLINLGDWFHANDSTNRTPASGAPLDVDGRLAHVLAAAKTLIVAIVKIMLVKFPNVIIVNARGNHDPDAAVYFNEIVSARWHHEPRVKVAPNTSKFVYIQHGKSLIGIHHGDRINRNRIYEAMTRDKRVELGQSEFVYFWTGHIHHKTAEEIGMCLFESFGILPPPDQWHSDSGYGAAREMQSIIMSKQDGIVARNVCGIKMARQYDNVLEIES